MIFNFLKRFKTNPVEFTWRCEHCGAKNDNQWQPSAGYIYQRRTCKTCGWTEEKEL